MSWPKSTLDRKAGSIWPNASNSASGGQRPVVLTSAFAEQDLEDLLAASSAIGFVSKAELSAQAIIDVLLWRR